jgi:N-methylhydantoinase B
LQTGIREYDILEDAEVQSACERYKHDLYGLSGGKTGTPGSARVCRSDGTVEELRATARFSVESGDRLITHTVGGGGYGNPNDRDIEAVRRDVSNELVSPEAAKNDYGVDPET